MPGTQSDHALSARPALPEISDDECVSRLAEAVAEHDSGHLDEVAALIGRLAVPLEI